VSLSARASESSLLPPAVGPQTTSALFSLSLAVIPQTEVSTSPAYSTWGPADSILALT
jgi:hypothetical protein